MRLPGRFNGHLRHTLVSRRSSRFGAETLGDTLGDIRVRVRFSSERQREGCLHLPKPNEDSFFYQPEAGLEPVRVRVRVRFRIAIVGIEAELRFLLHLSRTGDSNQGGFDRTHRRLTCNHYVASVPDKNWAPRLRPYFEPR